MNRPPQEVFGDIRDVAIDGNRVLILDGGRRLVSGFSVHGDFLFSVGGQGGGPGEFQSPVAMDVGVLGDLVVADANHRITRYAWDDSTYYVLGSFTTEVRPVDVATCGGNVVVHGTASGQDEVIRVYDRTGERKRGFGVRYPSRSSIVGFTLSWGLVWCLGEREAPSVVYLPEMTGPERDFEITAFDSAGRSRWRIQMADFRPIDFRIDPRTGGVEWDWVPPDGAHYALSGSHIAGTEVSQLQVAYQDSTREAVDDYQEIVTLFIGEGTGTLLGGTDRIPELAAVSLPLLVTVERHPYPELTVHRLRLGGE